MTRVALVGGIAVLGFMIVLAALGSTDTREVLIGLAALVVLVGGGNWLSARTRRATVPDELTGPDEPTGPDRPTGPDGPDEPADAVADPASPAGAPLRDADPHMRCPMEPWARLATATFAANGAEAAQPTPAVPRTGS